MGDRLGIRWVFPATAVLLLVAAAWCWTFVRARIPRQTKEERPA